jgi:hypothetical protein
MIIAKEEALNILACARELQDGSPWIDIHVSPFEVIFNAFRYVPNPSQDGIFSLDNSAYKAPSVGPLRLEADLKKAVNESRQQEASRMSILLYRQAYAHIGPRVLGDQMKLSGISQSLLLPVFQPESSGNEEMELVHRLYGGDGRFLLGYCIPNSIANADIVSNIKAAISRYEIKAIKLHPNITGIDLSTPVGKRRVEAILAACQEAGLPLVVHGGISPVIKNPMTGKYSSSLNLSQINWSITTKPVVISHAGMMGASLAEIENELLPYLKLILSRHDHIMIDISALELTALCLVLKNVDPGRIVFGSDFYYFSQWGAIVKLLHALKLLFSQFEDRFIKIVARNPAKVIQKGA